MSWRMTTAFNLTNGYISEVEGDIDIQQRKEQLRRKLLECREQMAPGPYLRASHNIKERLFSLPVVSEAETIHCYVSMNNRREVDTRPIIETLLAAGKRVAVPVSNLQEGTMRHFLINSLKDLEPNRWGVPEPDADIEKEIHTDDLDLAIVPMVGGDRERNRLGYGKGFYDRFLSGFGNDSLGLLFGCCLVDEIPTEPFDVRLHTVVTESQVI